jgi:hypothetical protein
LNASRTYNNGVAADPAIRSPPSPHDESGIAGGERDVDEEGGDEDGPGAAARLPREAGTRRRKDVVKRIWIAAVTFAVIAMTTVAVAAPVAAASTIDQQLRSSRAELRRARAQLVVAQEILAAAQAEHQRRGLGTCIRQVEVSRHAVRFWQAVIRDLRVAKARQALAKLEKSGAWRQLIERAAKKYGVSADGLYRLMMMESGGKVTAVGAGRYYGLFQYSLITWKDDWNPWRAESVFDGSAQIEASAYAVKKGMGHSLWGNTFPVAF